MIAVDAAVAGGAPMALLTLIGQETRAPDGEARSQEPWNKPGSSSFDEACPST
jgi:hypothetical protein